MRTPWRKTREKLVKMQKIPREHIESKDIRKKILKLEKKILRVQDELDVLQEELDQIRNLCKHPAKDSEDICKVCEKHVAQGKQGKDKE